MSKGRMPRPPGWNALVLVVTLLLASLPASAEETGLFDADGYRLDQYRAPVPETAPGAVTATLEDVLALQAAGAILLDVMGLRQFHIEADGSWITSSQHQTIPGAVWLPVVGWGRLEAWQDIYLDQSLARLTANNPEAPLIVFCQVDCWLSWNAARRISERGYTPVYWFPGGTDAWVAAGFPLSEVSPFPAPKGG